MCILPDINRSIRGFVKKKYGTIVMDMEDSEEKDTD